MLPDHKTKIICTIGPASESPEVLEKLILAGMNIARLNFSHGDEAHHARIIANIRAAAAMTGQRVAILADLPGPKIRLGNLEPERLDVDPGDDFTLTTETITGNRSRATMTFPKLPLVVKKGDTLFLNDGVVQLEVLQSDGSEVRCRVMVGGEIRSRVGLNLPGIDLGIGAFTEEDHRWLRFAAREGLDAVSQSFVESAVDIEAVREAARSMSYGPCIIAKIERARALQQIDSIIAAADGLMIARGDLGVEIPIEQIALVQKKLMNKATLLGKPVITATQMLESMTSNRRPTRAEATDVANAILDGTDCVMLSGESAIGMYPVEATAMLARIAAATEPALAGYTVADLTRSQRREDGVRLMDLIAMSVRTTVTASRLQPSSCPPGAAPRRAASRGSGFPSGSSPSARRRRPASGSCSRGVSIPSAKQITLKTGGTTSAAGSTITGCRARLPCSPRGRRQRTPKRITAWKSLTSRR